MDRIVQTTVRHEEESRMPCRQLQFPIFDLIMDGYKIKKQIGKGSFGSAYLVVDADGKHYVIKEVDLSLLGRRQQKESINEVRVLSFLKHPFIITYHKHFFRRNNTVLCIVMDFANMGDLYEIVKRIRQRMITVPESSLLKWFTQICFALKHMHDRNILHRDLKSQNIFLNKRTAQGPQSISGTPNFHTDPEVVVQLGDFGIARVLSNNLECARTAIGTPYYLSPEICREEPYSFKSDIWSLGCVLYELLTQRHAFEAPNIKAVAAKITRGSYPPLPSTVSADASNLVSKLLCVAAKSRPTINSLLDHPAIKHYAQQYNTVVVSPEFPISQMKTPLPAGAAEPTPSSARSNQPPRPSSAVNAPSPPPPFNPTPRGIGVAPAGLNRAPLCGPPAGAAAREAFVRGIGARPSSANAPSAPIVAAIPKFEAVPLQRAVADIISVQQSKITPAAFVAPSPLVARTPQQEQVLREAALARQKAAERQAKEKEVRDKELKEKLEKDKLALEQKEKQRAIERQKFIEDEKKRAVDAAKAKSAAREEAERKLVEEKEARVKRAAELQEKAKEREKMLKVQREAQEKEMERLRIKNQLLREQKYQEQLEKERLAQAERDRQNEIRSQHRAVIQAARDAAIEKRKENKFEASKPLIVLVPKRSGAISSSSSSSDLNNAAIETPRPSSVSSAKGGSYTPSKAPSSAAASPVFRNSYTPGISASSPRVLTPSSSSKALGTPISSLLARQHSNSIAALAPSRQSSPPVVVRSSASAPKLHIEQKVETKQPLVSSRSSAIPAPLVPAAAPVAAAVIPSTPSPPPLVSPSIIPISSLPSAAASSSSVEVVSTLPINRVASASLSSSSSSSTPIVSTRPLTIIPSSAKANSFNPAPRSNPPPINTTRPSVSSAAPLSAAASPIIESAPLSVAPRVCVKLSFNKSSDSFNSSLPKQTSESSPIMPAPIHTRASSSENASRSETPRENRRAPLGLPPPSPSSAAFPFSQMPEDFAASNKSNFHMTSQQPLIAAIQNSPTEAPLSSRRHFESSSSSSIHQKLSEVEDQLAMMKENISPRSNRNLIIANSITENKPSSSSMLPRMIPADEFEEQGTDDLSALIGDVLNDALLSSSSSDNTHKMNTGAVDAELETSSDGADEDVNEDDFCPIFDLRKEVLTTLTEGEDEAEDDEDEEDVPKISFAALLDNEDPLEEDDVIPDDLSDDLSDEFSEEEEHDLKQDKPNPFSQVADVNVNTSAQSSHTSSPSQTKLINKILTSALNHESTEDEGQATIMVDPCMSTLLNAIGGNDCATLMASRGRLSSKLSFISKLMKKNFSFKSSAVLSQLNKDDDTNGEEEDHQDETEILADAVMTSDDMTAIVDGVLSEKVFETLNMPTPSQFSESSVDDRLEALRCGLESSIGDDAALAIYKKANSIFKTTDAAQSEVCVMEKLDTLFDDRCMTAFSEVFFDVSPVTKWVQAFAVVKKIVQVEEIMRAMEKIRHQQIVQNAETDSGFASCNEGDGTGVIEFKILINSSSGNSTSSADILNKKPISNLIVPSSVSKQTALSVANSVSGGLFLTPTRKSVVGLDDELSSPFMTVMDGVINMKA